jgi:hypothetical protein
MSLSSSLQLCVGALPIVFLLGTTLLRFSDGADRPRAIVDGFLIWIITSYVGTEVFNLVRHIEILPFVLLWGSACTVVLTLLWRRGAHVSSFFCVEFSLPLFIVTVFVGVTLFIALTAAPNNWDSLSYHLPKIEHWIQDHSLAFYPTTNNFQNDFAPLAEILLLQVRILSGGDHYCILIQWLSMAVSVVAVFRIAGQLGGNHRQCWIAAVFLVTLPIGILESTSTQNDYVEAALLCIFVTLGLDAISQPAAPLGLVMAAAFAGTLSGLTKPVAFAIGFGFALWFALALGRDVTNRVRLLRLAAAVIVAALVLGPFAARFYAGAQLTKVKDVELSGSFGVEETLDNLIRHVVTNLAVGVPAIDKSVVRASDWLTDRLGLQTFRAETSDPEFGVYEPPAGQYVLHEDFGPNPVHAILLTIALAATVVAWSDRALSRRLIYCAAWAAGLIVFVSLKRFALWEVRLHLPGFALAAPIVALAWPVRWSHPKASSALVVFLAIASAPALLFNKSRELVPLWWQRPYPAGFDSAAYLAGTRLQNLFANQPQLLQLYRDAVDVIVQSKATQIGLVLHRDHWEYPVWVLLRDSAPDRHFRIEHVNAPGTLAYPLGSFSPEMLFWNDGEGEAPDKFYVDGQEFRRIFQSGPIMFHKDTIAVFARVMAQ